MSYPKRCWKCGPGAQWIGVGVDSSDGRRYGLCKKCQTATPFQQLSPDVEKASTLERLARFVSREEA